MRQSKYFSSALKCFEIKNANVHFSEYIAVGNRFTKHMHVN